MGQFGTNWYDALGPAGWVYDAYKQSNPDPNYNQLAQQQAGQYNQANRPNQSNPFGYSNWTQGQNGQWTQNAGFSGGLQNQFDQLTSQTLDPTAARQKAYQSEMAQINPAFNTREAGLKGELAAQGLDPNSEAGRGQMAQLEHAREGANQGAITNSYGLGSQDMQNTLMGLNTFRGLAQPFGFMPGQSPNLLSAAQLQNQSNADTMNGLGQLAGTAAMFAF